MRIVLRALGMAAAALAALLLGSYCNAMFYTGVFAPNILLDAGIALVIGFVVAIVSEFKKK